MTDSPRDVTIGSFRDRAKAERAVEALHRAGFTREEIGYASPDDRITPEDTPGSQVETEDRTMLGAVAGGVSGWVLGSVLGTMAAVVIPGIGPIIAGGGLAVFLAGAAGGTVAGGLIGALAGMGVPRREAEQYADAIVKGHTLVTVKAGDRFVEAQNILRDSGATEVNVYGR